MRSGRGGSEGEKNEMVRKEEKQGERRPMREPEYVLVSLCICGVPCRYHGKTTIMGHHIGRPGLIARLKEKYSILPLCPEQMGGLPTPRPACKVINNHVINQEGLDVTNEYMKGANEVYRLCRLFNVKKAYLLKNSPACGKGYGVLATLLEKEHINVIAV